MWCVVVVCSGSDDGDCGGCGVGGDGGNFSGSGSDGDGGSKDGGNGYG